MIIFNKNTVPEPIYGILKNNKTYVLTCSRTIETSTTPTLIKKFPAVKIQKDKNIILSISVPSFATGSSWGGMYITTNISVNGYEYSMGTSGYSGAVMMEKSQSKGTYINSKLVDLKDLNLNDDSEPYDVSIELYATSYSGTGFVNGNIAINDIYPARGEDGVLLESAASQNFTTVILEEVSR